MSEPNDELSTSSSLSLSSAEPNDEPSTSSAWSLSSAEVIRHKKGKPITKEEKIAIINCFKKVREANPTFSKTKLILEVMEMTGFGEISIGKILHELGLFGNVQPNLLQRPKDKKSFFETKLNDSDKDTIRRIIHDFFKREEIPTINSIFEAWKEDEDLPEMSRDSVYKAMKKLGFAFKKRDRDILKTERKDLNNWREEHITAI